ncbi:MAG: glutamine--fructose-6-phosphate transaminase (isomerizing) [Pseudomonadota bacterium]
MCGIVGYVGRGNAVPVLMEGLHQLEYRGYDSAGLALQRRSGLAVFKTQGKVSALRAKLPKRLTATVGIGHTRWATHGEPSDVNAHPQCAGAVALIHNGIIENAQALRATLAERGVTFVSQTDTEVLAALIDSEYAARAGDGPGDPGLLQQAVTAALRAVTGAYGIAVLHRDHPKVLIAARNGSPVVLGLGDKEMFVGSDAAALVRHTRQVIYLADGDVALVRADGYDVTDLADAPSQTTPMTLDLEAVAHSRGEYAHYTRKEIEEQPEVLARVLKGRLDRRFNTATLAGLNLSPTELLNFRRIKILGCGSAFISARLGAAMIERLARIPADAEPAAEFRYRNPIIETDTLYLAVSQSGETYDTLSAVQEIKRKGGTVRGIVNVVGSSIARECDGGVYLHAGPEIAVVSTKTMMATLAVMALLALHLGRLRDLSPAEGGRILAALDALPAQIEALCAQAETFDAAAQWAAQFHNAYFVGRNEGYALAMEGALKLKEISYVHAEAYPASELKHGPLALVDEQTLTVAVVPEDDLSAKNLSTLEEIRARRGPLLVVGHGLGYPVQVDRVLTVPRSHALLDPLLLLVPLQYLSYFAALALGRDVDQPRNLAKSVTVE